MTSERPVFLFGTLRDLALLDVVLGQPADICDAVLPDHRVARAEGQSYPLLVTETLGGGAPGILIQHPTSEQVARLDYYEAPYGYTLRDTTVIVDGTEVAARVYRPEQAQERPAEDWSLTAWQDQHGPLMREAAYEIMDAFGQAEPHDIAARMPVIRTRAQQRLNARSIVPAVKLRLPHTRDDVALHAKRRPYSHFFSVEEMDVAARQFDGRMPEPSERAIFLMADAVTVLPYDPVRDRVLLIEQFRPGSYLRGDANPWSLEVIAGRQDPGETHEQAVRREALEEAGLELGALELISRYYSSPGGSTEYMSSYLACVDLPDGLEGVGGLDSEAEDIRSMVISYGQLQEALEDGEADNAPLVISALWLSAHRDRLRAV